MTEQANCYTIANRADSYLISVSLGIKTEPIQNHDFTMVNLGHGRGVRLGMGSAETKPILLHGNVMQAVAVQKPSTKHYRLVKDDTAATSVLIHIIAADLFFSLEPFVRNLNFWAGGDAALDPIAESNNSSSPLERQQLYQLQHGESIFVIDRRGAVVRVICEKGIPFVEPVGLLELAKFILERVRLRPRAKAISWALYNVKALLPVAGKDAHHLSAIFGELDSLRAEVI